MFKSISSRFSREFALLVIFYLLASKAFPQYTYSHYSLQQGIRGRYIQQLLEDKYGFIWVATNNGLYRYDGHAFKGYFANPAQVHSLPNNDIRSITFDMEGNLWIGCWGGVAKMETRSGHIQRMPLDFVSGHDKVQFLKSDFQNRLWVATWLGLYLFDANGALIKHWRKGAGANDLPHEQCNSVLEDSQSRIWIGTTGGLCLFREETQDFKVYLDSTPAYTLNNHWLNSTGKLWMDSLGVLWFGAWANGFKRFFPETGEFKSFLPKPELAGHGAYNVITNVTVFDGKFWVASHDQGLGTFDFATNTFDFLRQQDSKMMLIPTTLCNTLLATSESLWIGTNRGLYAIHKKDQFVKVIPFKNIRNLTCLPSVFDISADPSDPDLLYVSTWSCGLFRFHLKKGFPEPVSDPVFKIRKDMDNVLILNHLVSRDSTLFIATSFGLSYKRLGSEFFELFSTTAGSNQVSDENYFYSLLQDERGTLWAGTRKGIVKINPKTMDWQRITIKETGVKPGGGLKDVVIDLTQNKRYIFFLRGPYGQDGANGLTIYNKKTGKFYSFVFGEGQFKNYPTPKTASRIQVWKERYLIVSSDEGLVIFDPFNPVKYLPFSAFHGLNSDHLYDIAIDKRDRIWVQSSLGLNCIDPGRELFTIGQENGLPDLEVTVMRILPDGRMICGLGEHYLLLLDPESLPNRDTAERVIKPVMIETEKGPISLNNTINLPLGTRYLRIHFSDFTFFELGENKFSIEVIHNNDTVSYFSESNKIELSNLEPGQYDFLITRNNSRGGIKVINPYRFYEKPYVQATAVGLIFLIAGAFVFRIQRNRYLKKQRMSRLKLQLVEYEMKSLRAQMNDHFIFNALTGINRFIYENETQKATSYLNKFSRLLRASLKGSRNASVSLEDELESIHYYVELEGLKFEHPPILVVIDKTNDSLANLLIPPMLIQPMVENAIKHGAEKVNEGIHIWIEVVVRDKELLEINVIDNAPVFLKNEILKGESSGLSLATKIIQERLDVFNEQAGINLAKFKIESTVFNERPATKSQLQIPLRMMNEQNSIQMNRRSIFSNILSRISGK